MAGLEQIRLQRVGGGRGGGAVAVCLVDELGYDEEGVGCTRVLPAGPCVCGCTSAWV